MSCMQQRTPPAGYQATLTLYPYGVQHYNIQHYSVRCKGQFCVAMLQLLWNIQLPPLCWLQNKNIKMLGFNLSSIYVAVLITIKCILEEWNEFIYLVKENLNILRNLTRINFHAINALIFFSAQFWFTTEPKEVRSLVQKSWYYCWAVEYITLFKFFFILYPLYRLLLAEVLRNLTFKIFFMSILQ